MKSMWPPLAAIFFMTNFYRAGGGGVPPDPLLYIYLVPKLRLWVVDLNIQDWLEVRLPFSNVRMD